MSPDFQLLAFSSNNCPQSWSYSNLIILFKKKLNRPRVPQMDQEGALLLCPCLFHPSDNVWRSRRADAPRCAHFSTVISPSWITEKISVGKCAYTTEAHQRVRSAKRGYKISQHHQEKQFDEKTRDQKSHFPVFLMPFIYEGIYPDMVSMKSWPAHAMRKV